MLEKLVLKDFKSHIESEIEFRSGLNVFLGEVGAGKSSILEALSFALFGRYAGNVTQEELIRRGAKQAEIILIFQTSSKYKVERTIHRTKNQTVKLWVNDGKEWKLVVDGAKATSKSIEKLLDADPSTFLTAIYTSQGEIKEMLETQPGKRRERLDRLLGIDIYEKIWEILGNTITLILNDLTKLQDKSSGFSLLKDQKEGLEKQLERNENELKMLKGFLVEIKERLEPEEKKIEKYEKMKMEEEQTNTEMKIKNAEMDNSLLIINSLRNNLKKAGKSKAVYEKNKRYIALEKNLNKQREQIEIHLQQKSSLDKLLQKDESYLKGISKRRDRLRFQLERLEKLIKLREVLDEKTKDVKELKREQNKNKKNLDELKNKIAKMSNEVQREKIKSERVEKLGECPTCLQSVPKNHKNRIKKETNKTIDKLKTEYDELEKIKAQYQLHLNDVEEKLDFASKNEVKISETSIQIRMLKEEVGELEEINKGIKNVQNKISKNMDERSKIKETSDTLAENEEKLYEAINKAKIAKEAEKQISSIEEWQKMFLQEEKKIEKVRTDLISLTFLKKEITSKYNKQEYIKIESKVKTLSEEQIRTKEGMERLRNTTKDLKKQIKNLEENIKNKKTPGKKLKNLKLIK